MCYPWFTRIHSLFSPISLILAASIVIKLNNGMASDNYLGNQQLSEMGNISTAAPL